MSRFKNKYKSLYWQQFLLTASLVLLTLVLLGVSFFALSYHYTLSERREEMRDRAQLVAPYSVKFLQEGFEGTEDNLNELARIASLMSDVDFLICNEQGNALLATDEQLRGQVVTLPREMVSTIVEKGVYEGGQTLGVYSSKQVVVGVPVLDGGRLLGFVVAVTETTELMEMWRAFFGLFLMTSAIILLISFLATSFLSMRQAQPIREMVQATRKYAEGDFDAMVESAKCLAGSAAWAFDRGDYGISDIITAACQDLLDENG